MLKEKPTAKVLEDELGLPPREAARIARKLAAANQARRRRRRRRMRAYVCSTVLRLALRLLTVLAIQFPLL